jgi:hypothetical protein
MSISIGGISEAAGTTVYVVTYDDEQSGQALELCEGTYQLACCDDSKKSILRIFQKTSGFTFIENIFTKAEVKFTKSGCSFSIALSSKHFARCL